MYRGLILSFLSLFFILQGCGERIVSLKLISSELFNSPEYFNYDENYKYIKLKVNSNDFSYLARGYEDLGNDGEIISVWYSSDKHVLRTKHGRLHSISSVSSLWYGQEYLTTPKNTFSDNESFQRIRFGNKSFNTEVMKLYILVILKFPINSKNFVI